MLSSSSSSAHDQDHKHIYDVFLSFRGSDTRYSFTGHLHKALRDGGFITFLDDEEIETGEQLKPELESAIKFSRASIIVLSKNYAFSTWCLDELVLILEQRRNFSQLVIPIFYGVDPSDVRNQLSTFGESMAEHELRMEAETDAEKKSQLAQKIELWKRALTEVANLKGIDVKYRKETQVIEQVVTDIHLSLGALLTDSRPLLIGRDHYIASISSWLTDGSRYTADILTVVGLQGIGKSSLAKYVFQLHRGKFEGGSFIEGINEICNELDDGLLILQNQLHRNILNGYLHFDDVSECTSGIERALANKRVFIVLDDVGCFSQLDALLGDKGLHPGSKIIITTEDGSLTEKCALFNPQVQPVHMEVVLKNLNESESLEFLCIQAFKSRNPKEGYEDVLKELVKYCEGLPLALEDLGRFLRNRDIAFWEECIQLLIKESDLKIKEAKGRKEPELVNEAHYIFGSSSSSSTLDQDHNHKHIHDVYLSFRDSDTLNGFTDHLYNALLDADIKTFFHGQEIETGKALKPELESAIKSSRASIIVFSENYASSTWCLDELVLILDQQKTCNQLVIPIFYHVEPTDIKEQQRTFGEAMAKHNQRMEAETNAEKRSQLAQKIESWKRALTQVAKFEGKDAKDRRESELIEQLVTHIHRILGGPLSNTLPLLIGRGHYIQLISSWLTDGSWHTANILTVVGMGGIGKTSLARYVFLLHSSEFHESSFVEGISKRCNEFNGLLGVQKQLHRDVSKKKKLQLHDVSVYTSKIENALARKKVLIVLDDVDCFSQLDALLGNKGLHPGSKVIITTKDASLTEMCALFKARIQTKHKMVRLNGLSGSESVELLRKHAFSSQNPEEGYKEVLEKLVKYCDGLPLALEVLGRSLYKRDVRDRKEFIEWVKKEPCSDIKGTLKTSFEVLPSKSEKNLFKHIACFFVGKDRDFAETVLNACDINTISAIRCLIDRCLLAIGRNNELVMHSLIQEMGRDLVRLESLHKPWMRSRLWCHEESLEVLEQNKGTENILGLALDMKMLDTNKLCELKTESFSPMGNLMFLQLNYVQLIGSYKNFPQNLRWLCMHGSPLKAMPLYLPMENLVALDMSYSNIESFDVSNSNPQPHAKRQKGLTGSSSNNKQLLRSLKILDLSFCKHLHTLGGFGELPALERLIVRNCISLIEVCNSVENCVDLVHIDLSYCHQLKKVPTSIGKLKKIRTLLLDGCISLESQIKMPPIISSDASINSATSSSTIMHGIPSDLKFFVNSFASTLRSLSLAHSNLYNESFPMDLSRLSLLEDLCLDENPIVSMPSCVRTLPRLKILGMNNCEMVRSVERPPCTLRELSIFTDKKNSLTRIKFDPEMSPLKLNVTWKLRSGSSLEIDGVVKIQDMAGVEEKVLQSLGWENLDFVKEMRFKPSSLDERSEEFQTQMYYEFGIFSTMYEGKEMPNWISYRRDGPLILFTIPSSPKKLRGLNFCCVETISQDSFVMPIIKVSNITKKCTWIYDHDIERVKLGGERFILLSHWMFGPNEMKAGDHVTIIVAQGSGKDQRTMKCGISVVYADDDRMIEEDKEDVMSYYKSWNHIIGGDLSAFQLTSAEYILNNRKLMRDSSDIDSRYLDLVRDDASYKEEEVRFKAFSKKSLKYLVR